MKALKFNNTEVSLNFTTYRNNGTLAVQMNTVPDDDLYGVITVNLCCPLQSDKLAFVDELIALRYFSENFCNGMSESVTLYQK